jgi:hypothetical protein
MSRLLNLYENIIKFAGLSVNSDGYVFVAINDKREPFTIDGKQVVLPTKEHLKNSINKTIFHPLRENLMGGESEIVKAYRNALAIRFNVASTTIGQYLLLAAASSDQQQKLNAEQMSLVTSLGDVDAKTIENYNRVVMAGMKLDPYKNFVSLFLRKGDTILGKRYARVCITTFPIYEQLVEGKDKINGVKIRVKDVDTFIKLHRFMLSGIGDQHSYSAGTNSRIAPYMEALMDASQRIASSFNDILAQYRDFIDDADSLVFNSDWVEDFTNLDDINSEIIRIPSQSANKTTSVLEEESSSSDTQQSPVVAEHRQTPVVSQPQVQHTSIPPVPPPWIQPPMRQQQMPIPARAPNGPVSVKDLLAMSPGSNMAPNPLAPILQQGMLRQQYPQPGYPQPGMMPMMQPGMQYPQPVYQQPGMMPMMQQPMQQYPQQMQPGMQYPQPGYPQPGMMPNMQSYPHPGTPAMR